MNREEASLLLYLETRAVDHGGLVDTAHMNEADFDIARRWADTGLIGFGRRKAHVIWACAQGVDPCTHWVLFSEKAWTKAHRLRRERASRILGESEESQEWKKKCESAGPKEKP